MTAAAIETSRWTWRRWCLLIVLTFCAQLALIAWLGDKSPARIRRSLPAPPLAMVRNPSSELIALTDPTLFALPHQQGFSGPAWMKIPSVPTRSFELAEEPQWLALPVEQLGKMPDAFRETNRTDVLTTTFASFEPEPTTPEFVFTASFHDKSELLLGEELTKRQLKTVPKLPSWPHSDILTNTVVKLFVNSDGLPASPAVLLSSSGLKAADDYALAQANATQFEPTLNEGPGRTKSPLANLTWGTMIFEWQTLPLSATNNASLNPAR
jgi:hypothetical protein